jgi:tRNA pseudouridine13 synthase
VTPRWLDGPGAGGRWKVSPEDFVVTELPLAPTARSGRFQWLWVEKIGRSTPEVAQALARAAGVDLASVGYAGLKDREARATQAFTIDGGRRVRGLPDGMRILDGARTQAGLRPGQLRGNRFAVRVRGGDARVAAERLGWLPWMPNAYGPQRVGGDAPGLGHALLSGRGPRLPPGELKFALSAWQSVCFNRVLWERGSRRLVGDLEEGGVPTGPMYGARMRWPRGEAAALEELVLGEERLPPRALERFGSLTQGTRRAAWVKVEARVEATEDGFWLHVELPAGSYATVLLEQIA